MNWLENPVAKYLLVVIVILTVIIVGSAIVAFALSGKYKKRTKTGGLELPDLKEWSKSPIINGLWAIAGLLFAYWLLSQIWPAFWEKWSNSAGFWWLPIALVAGFWLIGKKGGQAPTVAAFIIGIAILAVTITSCRSIWAVHKEKTTNVQITAVPRTIVVQRKGYEPRSPVVVATPDKISNPISIPFGKDFWIDTKGNVFCFKNGRPFLWNGRHLILKPGDTGIPFGTDCRSLAFQSAEPNNIVVVIHLRDHQQ